MHSLQAAKTAIRTNCNHENVQELLDKIDQRLTSEDIQLSNVTEQPVSGLWHATVRQSVHDIIYPTEIAWMEGDEHLSDGKFAQRAVDEIKDRFTRYFIHRR